MTNQIPQNIPVVSPVGTNVVAETIANLTRKGGTMLLGDGFSGIVDHALAMARRDAESGKRVIVFGTTDQMFALDKRYGASSTATFQIYGHRVHDYSIDGSDGDVLGPVLANQKDNVIVDFSAMTPRAAAHFLRKALDHVIDNGRDFSGAQLYLLGLDDFLSRKRHYDGPAVIAIRTLMIRHALRTTLHTTSSSWEDVPLEFRKYLPNIIVGHTPNREDVRSLNQALDNRILTAHHFIGGFQRLARGHAFAWPRADVDMVAAEPYHVGPSQPIVLSGGNDYHSRKKATDAEKDVLSDMKAARKAREDAKKPTAARSGKVALAKDGTRNTPTPSSRYGLEAFLGSEGIQYYSHAAIVAKGLIRHDRHGNINAKNPVSHQEALEVAQKVASMTCVAARYLLSAKSKGFRDLMGTSAASVLHVLITRSGMHAERTFETIVEGRTQTGRDVAAKLRARRAMGQKPGHEDVMIVLDAFSRGIAANDDIELAAA